MKKLSITLILLATLAADCVFGQERLTMDRLDTLIGTGQYATAYTLARDNYRKAQTVGGTELFDAAFYLTALDYAYNRDATDSALIRYSQLVHTLQGADRAMAYAFLFQTYNSVYHNYYYNLRNKKPSDDPKLSCYQWDLRRMEDTLTACADSVLAFISQSDGVINSQLSILNPQLSTPNYPLVDSTLKGMLVQSLLSPKENRSHTILLSDSLYHTQFLPLPEYCRATNPNPQDTSLPYPLPLHRRVAELYKEGSADMMLWLDLQRFSLFLTYHDSLFITALDSLARYYYGKIESGEMKALLALRRAEYLSFGQRKVEAEQICLATERDYPGTYGARSCSLLRRDICQPEYEIGYNEASSSKRSRMACVNSRNVKLLTLRIVPNDSIPDSLFAKDRMDDWMRLPAVKEWQQPLPDPGDHLWHEYLIALPPVPQGDYHLVVAADSSFCHNSYQSADAAFITYHIPPAPGNSIYLSPSSGYIIDRVTGLPMANNRVTLHMEGILSEHEYQHRCRTDNEGYFHFPVSSLSYIMKDCDKLSVRVDGYEYYGDMLVGRSYNEYQEHKMLNIVMTDRPIYRLGDTVQFSCVAYTCHNRGKEWRIDLRPKSRLKLKANFGLNYSGGTRDTIELVTDKHGRCHGQFVIPNDSRNGDYWLRISDGNGYYNSRTIRVEAYKPPHFTVSLSTARDSAATARRFNQPITIYGTAASYSGAPMTGTKVKWEVSCEEMVSPLMHHYSVADKFPYHDSLVVGADGLFQFTFTPREGDLENSKSKTYIYTAYARVTDADGEMHEHSLSFHVGDADGYCVPTGDDLSHLTFAYNNFDHQPLEGAVQVEIYRLQQPDTIRTLDPIMEEQPKARWVGSREEFHRLFPYRAFSSEEGDPHSWPVVDKRLDLTTEGRTVDIDGLPSGMYRITFSTPDGGRHDTLMNYVAPGGRVTGNDLVWTRFTPRSNPPYYNDVTCSVGDTVRIELGSPYGNQPMYYRVTHAAKTYMKGMMLLDSIHTSTLAIPITDKMKDGCEVSLAAMREELTFNATYTVLVRRPDMQLKITTETFRDRLQPGEKEEWKIRVAEATNLQGDNGTKGTAANLCFTMYDLSLNQLARTDASYGFYPWARRYSELYTNISLSESLSMSHNQVAIPSDASLKSPQFGLSLPTLSEYYMQIALRFNPGSVVGTVMDAKTKEMLPFVNVVLNRNGHKLAGATTDFDGQFRINAVPTGEYELVVRSVGYRTFSQQIVVKQDAGLVLNISMSPTATNLECVEIVSKKRVPIIEIGAPQHGARLSSDDIARMPGNSVESIVATVAGVGYIDGTKVAAPKDAIAEIMAPLNFDGNTGDKAVSYRRNMSTVAFFEPSLRSDKDGYATLSFTMPDALTQWRLYGIAWSDRFQLGTFERTVQTQKELMVQPLMPRFLRQGDTTDIRAKVSNLSDTTMEVEVTMEIENNHGTAASSHLSPLTSHLTLAPHSSGVATFRVPVGNDWHVAEYKVSARCTDGHGIHRSDGEQGELAVLPNRERVTESRLLYVAGTTDPTHPRTATYNYQPPTTDYPLDTVSISFTSNPMDYAVAALPHFKRHRMPGNIYLANSIYVNHLTSTLPTLTDRERANAAERAKSDIHDLLRDQVAGGGWSWMPNGKTASRYVTESVLQRLSTCPSLAFDSYYNNRYYKRPVEWLDKQLVKDYTDVLNQLPTTHSPLSTLYTRTLYLDIKPLEQCDSITRMAYDYFYLICKMHSRDEMPLYLQGQLALLMLHMGDTAEAVELAGRIKGAAHTDDNLGMYWTNNVSGYGWYERPIETAALMVDVFADVLHDWQSVNRIQQWILSSKQGTTWKTDMATATAVRALLRTENGERNGEPRELAERTENGEQPTLTLNGQTIEDADTTLLSTPNFQLSTFNFQLKNPSPFPAWGAVFFSYEAPIDSIQYNGTGISLRKTLSRVDSDGSQHLLGPESTLRVGDRIRVHIDIYCERDMDNMVLNDQRAAAFEPMSTASGWCYNDGLRYYVDVRDERTDCYIDRLDQGHYYVEYDVLVRHSGTFATGIGNLHSVYAPEFRANTESIRLNITY